MLWFKDNKSNTFNDLQLFLVSLIISAVLLFVYSKNSIIYPMNDYCDENNFFSITDSMFHGMVLYRDIFEHKGPFLFFIYSLIHILGNSYFTLWMVECITNTLFIYFGTKTILLYDKEPSRTRIFLYALCLEFCLCTSTVFMFGGTPEELFLWMSSYGLYITLRCLKQNQYYSPKELVIIGILCGAIFWTKYSLLGFYSGLALYIIGWNIAQKKFLQFCKTIVIYLTGFTISMIPILAYGLATQNMHEMVDLYFIGNIFGQHSTSTYASHFYALLDIIQKDIFLVSILATGILYILIKEECIIRLLIIITVISTFLSSCCLKVFWTYYPMPMLIFVPFGIIAWKNLQIKQKAAYTITLLLIILHLIASEQVSLFSPLIGTHINYLWLKEYVRVLTKAIITFIILYITITNKKFVRYRISSFILRLGLVLMCAFASLIIRDPNYFTVQPLPQLRFKEIIQRVDNASILVYGTTDFGFNKSSHTYPQVKYFCNVDLIANDTKSEQQRYIRDEIVDFIITTVKPDEMKEKTHGTSYALIDSAEPYFYNGYTLSFFLYEKQRN